MVCVEQAAGGRDRGDAEQTAGGRDRGDAEQTAGGRGRGDAGQMPATPPMLQFPVLSGLPGVVHGFSTRLGGVSEGIYESLNLSFSRGDDAARVLENYRRASAYFGTVPECIITVDQQHTGRVVRVDETNAGEGVVRERSIPEADGMVTDVPGLLLSTFHADCTPIFLVDPVRRAIGLVHSGWRGTKARIARNAIRKMAEDFGSRPQDLFAGIGPSICRDCYEIGEEVAEELAADFAMALRKRESGKWDFDLFAANRAVLLDSGVLASRISVSGICTCENAGLLFSHRATQGQRGNLAAFLMLR